MKYGVMFVSLLAAGLGFAGGVDNGRAQIALPCLAWMVTATVLLIRMSKKDERREKDEKVLRVRTTARR